MRTNVPRAYVCIAVEQLDDEVDRAIIRTAWEVGLDHDLLISAGTYSSSERGATLRERAGACDPEGGSGGMSAEDQEILVALEVDPGTKNRPTVLRPRVRPQATLVVAP